MKRVRSLPAQHGKGGNATVTAAPRGYRPELQGLRALAVVYHIWFNRISGGVDVFFVITGFLLTGQLARAAERGSLDLTRRWSRTVVRLVRPTIAVLFTTVIAAAIVLPETTWSQTIRELATSALFVENWELAANAVDSSASNDMASVVQPFWSLSIQGQFFLVWPILVALVVGLTRSRGAR